MCSLPSSFTGQFRRQLYQCARQQTRRSEAGGHGSPPLLRQSVQRRTYSGNNPLRRSQEEKEHAKAAQHHKRRMKIAAAGMVMSALAMFGTIRMYSDELKAAAPGSGANDNASKDNKTGTTAARTGGGIKLDGPIRLDLGSGATTTTEVVDVEGVERVETGNSTIPYFPKSIRLPKSLDSSTGGQQQQQKIGEEVRNDSNGEEEYQLLGLGIRTVSFLNIQVYVVGLYIAKTDIAALQKRLVREAVALPPSIGGPNGEDDSTTKATLLVPQERDTLKQCLLDPERGEDVWAHVLKGGGIRTALRIVPTRNTDFLHLRDGWVRAITGRAQKVDARAKELAKQQHGQGGVAAIAADATPGPEFSDDSFGAAMNQFKSLLGGGFRKNVPKGQTLLLLRDRVGTLDILYQPGNNKKPFIWLGQVSDERLSRLLWMGYLAGKSVASESARQSVVNGVMAVVERPIGTVEQKVV